MKPRPINRLNDDLVPGTRLGPYEVVAALGAGGMGHVYRARDTRLGREVALKTLDPARTEPRQLRRFDREAQLASGVSHPHVLMVLDVGEWQGRPFIVSELLQGSSLREHLRRGTVPTAQAVGWAVQVCRGLQAIHAGGIVHRDLKPENVFVTCDGWIKILDLGLAGPIRDDEDGAVLDTTEDAPGAGTTAYMAPEQVRRQPLDARADIFACGVILYEMLGRRRPFDEETAAETMTAILRREPAPLRRLQPGLPAPLERIVERCLRKRPEDRFHSAHDLALALEAAVADVPRAAEVSRPDSPARPSLTGWSLAAAAALLLGANVWWHKAGPAATDGVVLAGIVHPTLVRYDASQRRFAPYLAGAAMEGVETSRDGRFITYTTHPQGELWRANADGSRPVKLTSSPLRAAFPRWSPDGTRIAFVARAPERPWRVHVIPAEGGPIEVLPPDDMMDPGWTPDGRAIVMGMRSSDPGAIFEWDLESRRLIMVPGSQGFFSPRLSPDGRYLAALDVKTWQIAIRDQRTGTWARHGSPGAAYPSWTRDASWLHFRRDGAFGRIDPATGREESVATLDGAVLAGGEWGAWTGLAPDDSPLVLVSKDPYPG